MKTWFKNRINKFLLGIPTGLLTILFTIGVAFGMEYRDKQFYGYFDWEDVSAILLGGLAGQIIQAAIIALIIFV